MREPVFTGCFGRLIDQQLDHGVDAICVCGTTGESATLSIREHIAAVAFCVKRVNHRVKVIAGAGSNDTSAALYLSQHAQDSGADALLLAAFAAESLASLPGTAPRKVAELGSGCGAALLGL